MANASLGEKPVFYTYIHRQEDDNAVFYVGKGKLKRAYSRYGRNPYWKKIVKKHGLKVEIVAHWELESEAFEHEKFLISCFKDTGSRLCNLTDGGEGRSGYKLSEESIRLISIKNTGKKRTAEQNEKNAERSRGKVHSRETIDKRIAACTGKIRSKEHRENISKSLIGRSISEDHRAKISAGNKGRVRSDEFKEKITIALTGRVCSEETRRKISESQKGKVITQEMRDKISKTLTGRKASDATRAKLQAIADDPERRARQSAIMKSKPYSEEKRLASIGVPWSASRREAHEKRFSKNITA